MHPQSDQRRLSLLPLIGYQDLDDRGPRGGNVKMYSITEAGPVSE